MIIIILSYLIKSNMREYNHSNTILHLHAFEVICTSHKKEHIFMCICICICVSVSVHVCVCVCQEDVHEKRIKRKDRKQKSKEEKRKEKNLFIQINIQTDR